MVTTRMAELIRKIWNPKNFKGHVSPHELLQAVILKSNKQFIIEKQSDPLQLMSWLLLNLEKEARLKLAAKSKSADIISQCFKGLVEVKSYQPLKGQVGYQANPLTEVKPF